jgi:predicted DNA-binding transcriptional regulator AlpA
VTTNTATAERRPTLLRRQQVEQRLGVKCSTIYLLMARGELPRPIHPSSGVSCWLESDIEDFIARKRDEARAEQAARGGRAGKIDAAISATAAGRPVRHPDDTFELLGEPVARAVKKLGTKL